MNERIDSVRGERERESKSDKQARTHSTYGREREGNNEREIKGKGRDKVREGDIE